MAVRERSKPVRSALDEIAAKASAEYGGTVLRKANTVAGHYHLDTGIFVLDYGLLGGIPEGMVTMFYGYERSGKSTLALRTIAAAQRKYQNKTPVLVDVEGTFDPRWAVLHGVDLERLIIAQPESGEQAVDILVAVLETEETSVAVIDSIAGMNPTKMLEESAGDINVALLARLTGKMCSKVVAAILDQRSKGHWPTAIFINQFRYKIGVMFGDNRTLPGGVQQLHTSNVRVEIKIKKEHEGVDSHGLPIATHTEHAFTIKKSKVGASLREGEFTMISDPEHMLGAGAIDDAATVLAFAKSTGMLVGGPKNYTIPGFSEERFNKQDDITDYLNHNRDVYNLLKRALIMARRTTNGLLPVPADGYLLGYCDA